MEVLGKCFVMPGLVIFPTSCLCGRFQLNRIDSCLFNLFYSVLRPF